MPDKSPVIVWFRQDLRLSDNPALTAACKEQRPVLPVYVLDDENAGDWRPGSASRWWLHQSLEQLDKALDGGLLLLRGDAGELIPELVSDVDARAVFWNRLYEPWAIRRDSDIKARLQDASIKIRSFNGSLLFDPPNTNKADGTPYRVFTPFYRKGCLENGTTPRRPLEAPDDIDLYRAAGGLSLDEFELMPKIEWYEEIAAAWNPGESGAHEQLQAFLDSGIEQYKDGRNRPDKPYVSRLSPHLHFGEISPNQVWYAVDNSGSGQGLDPDRDTFLSELGWREFSYNLLYNEPEMPGRNLQRKFDRFPWRDDSDALEAWQRGRTGYPIVDAGMRQLWRTGYMHNRVRMIVGSFLVKNLMLHWHDGERWFWDTLLDADLANNSASWQWVAGCGADAAPYFRIFNPVTQGKKFDPDGTYVRHYVPELAELPAKHIHAPWEAPADVLEEASVVLGDSYPEPIVELKASRERALDAFKSLSSSSS